MTTLSTGEMMLAAALIIGIATACQVIAPLLRVPALILLLPAGFLLGVIAPDFRADQIIGPAFPVVVDLIVAIILFQGGMELGTIPLKGGDRNVVRRLVWIGGAITWLCGVLASHFILGLDWPVALILGAILIVSGPTVVTPILDFARPEGRVRGILMWEGTILDPLGAIFAVVVFTAVRASSEDAPLGAALALFGAILVAMVAAAIGVVVTVLAMRISGDNRVIRTQILVCAVLVTAGFANFIAPESGLLAALLMGVATRPVARRLNTPLDNTVPFFNTVTSMGIGILFVSIAALVPSSVLAAILLPAIGMAVVLIIVVRPMVAAVCTARAGLSGRERAFIGCMDPRGIVAAATSSSVGAALVAANVAGADVLLPAAFVIITVTVFVYGLGAVPIARALGIRADPADASETATSSP